MKNDSRQWILTCLLAGFLWAGCTDPDLSNVTYSCESIDDCKGDLICQKDNPGDAKGICVSPGAVHGQDILEDAPGLDVVAPDVEEADVLTSEDTGSDTVVPEDVQTPEDITIPEVTGTDITENVDVEVPVECDPEALGPESICDDENECTSDQCVEGVCVNEVQVGNTCGGGGDLCQPNLCDEEGQCVAQPMDCDDGDACTVDGCAAGNCTHSTLDCDDGAFCNEDSCDALTGCVHTYVEGFCFDNNECTEDLCGGEAVVSEFGDGSSGCYWQNVSGSCDDGDNCTFADACVGGVCTGIEVDCNDGDLCGEQYCNESGNCVEGEGNCDDGDPCTLDGCDPEVGCVYVPTVSVECGTMPTLIPAPWPASGDPAGDMSGNWSSLAYEMESAPVGAQIVLVFDKTLQLTSEGPEIDVVLSLSPVSPNFDPSASDVPLTWSLSEDGKSVIADISSLFLTEEGLLPSEQQYVLQVDLGFPGAVVPVAPDTILLEFTTAKYEPTLFDDSLNVGGISSDLKALAVHPFTGFLFMLGRTSPAQGEDFVVRRVSFSGSQDNPTAVPSTDYVEPGEATGLDIYDDTMLVSVNGVFSVGWHVDEWDLGALNSRVPGEPALVDTWSSDVTGSETDYTHVSSMMTMNDYFVFAKGSSDQEEFEEPFYVDASSLETGSWGNWSNTEGEESIHKGLRVAKKPQGESLYSYSIRGNTLRQNFYSNGGNNAPFVEFNSYFQGGFDMAVDSMERVYVARSMGNWNEVGLVVYQKDGSAGDWSVMAEYLGIPMGRIALREFNGATHVYYGQADGSGRIGHIKIQWIL